MTITLPLQAQPEAKLAAAAQARGVSMLEPIQEAVNAILAGETNASVKKEPTLSLKGLLAKYGTAPSSEEIDRNRVEMLANFARSDF